MHVCKLKSPKYNSARSEDKRPQDINVLRFKLVLPLCKKPGVIAKSQAEQSQLRSFTSFIAHQHGHFVSESGTEEKNPNRR